jgi:hypothetical protein
MSYHWLINRLKTMNIFEIIFRIKQQLIYAYYKVTINKKTINPLNKTKIELGLEIEIFGLKINSIENWHYDIYTNKNFPLIFSFDIDIRTGRLGSAKYVWEINRFIFLPQIALRFKKNENENDLLLIIDLIESWVKENPYLIGVNWYSNIEINIRLINFYLTWKILDAVNLNNQKFKDFYQDTWLPLIKKHCEYSFSFPSYFSSANNHLISEYSGLYIASTVWKFNKSKKWNLYSKKGLEKEIIKQHTVDGINKEEAAEYIQFITDFFIIAYSVGLGNGNNFSLNYKNTLLKIISYCKNLLDIKGNFLQYGDEDDGRVTWLNGLQRDNNFISLLISGTIISNSNDFLIPNLVFDVKNRVLFGAEGETIFLNNNKKIQDKQSAFYSKSGHFLFRKQTSIGKEILLHFDVAPLGYLSIAAHGHSDALSIILHIDGYPFLVDSGTYTYHTNIEWRYYFISTLAHNTIEINNQNQALSGGPLLWLKHYQCQIEEMLTNKNNEIVKGSHNGYLKFGIMHQRKIEFLKNENHFIVTDFLKCDNNKDYSINMPWHLHPECKISKNENNTFTISRPETDRKLILKLDSNLENEIISGSINPILGWYSPSFYKMKPTTTLFTSQKKIKKSKQIITHLIIE